MRCATTAASSRSPRNFGKILPATGSPTWWPARPMRCRPRATEPGDSTWTTRSTAPMSMPSSSEDVATIARSRPAFSASSISIRCSRASEPWCARTRSSSASSLRRAAAARPGGARYEHDRRAVRADQLEEPRVDRRPDRGRAAAAVGDGRAGRRRQLARPTSPSSAMSSTGTIDLELERLAGAGVDDRDRPRPVGRPSAPPRKRAISSSGRCVADSPMRCGGRARSSASSRSSERRGARRAWSPPARGSRRR